MRKLLLLSLLNLAWNIHLCAQSPQSLTSVPKTPYEYYITISNLTTRTEVETLQNIIGGKEGIKFFMANRFPVRYFLMKSDRLVTAAEFGHWMNNSLYQVTFYGEGSKGLERVVFLYNKSKAR